MATISRHFQMHFLEWKCMNFADDITEVCSNKGPINHLPALVQIMVWHRPGDKPLSEPMMVRLPIHIYATRPWWIEGDPEGNCTCLTHWGLNKMADVLLRRQVRIYVLMNTNDYLVISWTFLNQTEWHFNQHCMLIKMSLSLVQKSPAYH